MDSTANTPENLAGDYKTVYGRSSRKREKFSKIKKLFQKKAKSEKDCK